MPHAHRRAPVLVQDAARGALDVGPEVRGVGQVEVGTKTVFNPSVLAVDFNPKSRRKTPRNPVGSRSFKLKVRETHGLFLLTSIVHL